MIAVMFIALGLSLFTFDLTQFCFTLVLIASFVSGLLLTLTQKVKYILFLSSTVNTT